VTRRHPYIPTDAEFEKARRMRAERDRDWDEIARIAKLRLSEICDLHELVIVPTEVCRFSAILFLPTDSDAAAARLKHFDQTARDLIEQVIRPFRSGECDAIDIHVEIDSDETVRRDFGGYFNRLR
jgi:hypothetical protein